MKFLKLSLALVAMLAVSAFFSCGNNSSNPPAPPTLAEILTSKTSKTWKLDRFFENGAPSSANIAGFEVTFKLDANSSRTGTYTITPGSFNQPDKWFNYKTLGQTSGTFSVTEPNDITFGSGSTITAVKFGGVTPTPTSFTLEWTQTDDKTKPVYRMVFIAKN